VRTAHRRLALAHYRADSDPEGDSEQEKARDHFKQRFHVFRVLRLIVLGHVISHKISFFIDFNSMHMA
jgi:hypothetical protein